jgi:hypothetical protein
VISATIRDQGGNPVAYTGTETLTTTVWPGGARPALFSPATTWGTSPSTGAIQITITAAETTSLAPGRYQLLTRVTAAGADPLDAYGATIQILGASGTQAAPATYPYDLAQAYDRLFLYGRSWIRQLQSDDDQAAFAEHMGAARQWLEGCGHAHFRVSAMQLMINGRAFGPRRSGARSTWLIDQFAANTLMVTQKVEEACAKKALAFICAGQVGTSEASAAYAKLAAFYHAEADYIASTLTLELDTNGDGFADTTIDLSCTDPMYG